MQDIVFYAAANETLGVVRDYANSRNEYAPTLVLGVAVCLRMRLFAGSESAAPYPVTSFSDITGWKWRMDADFDRETPYKLTADANSISVQTVTDTIDGETLSFTEFEIPISDMNTQELTDWLGNDKKKSGLTGELVGYDSSGNAVFVLQIDDFTVRNRIAGLNEPTSNDQEYLTSSETEQLVRTEIASATVAKQDKLTSANAGAGIAIDSGGTISMACVILGATNGVKIADGKAQFDPETAIAANGSTRGAIVSVADGLLVSGGTASIDDASVEDTLSGIVSGGTASIGDEVVTPGNLRGALSVGQAVDVTCEPAGSKGSWTYEDGDFLKTITWTFTRGASGSDYFGFINAGISLGHWFPKASPGLKYLFIADIVFDKNVGMGAGTNATAIGSWTGKKDAGATRRIALTATAAQSGSSVVTPLYVTIYSAAGQDCVATITNCRQYEVTALTDEAIAFLAQLPDPDAFFRSTSAAAVLDKYLVKQDMVCPWSKTISMPDNKDFTVAAGLSYRIKYTNNSAHRITVDTIPADAYGRDSHIQMFIKGTEAIQFQSPLVLMEPLTANAGHNLIVKYRNGQALVYVDDTDAGYVVTVTGGTANGSLNIGLTDTTSEYIIFGSTTNGAVCDFGIIDTPLNYNANVLGNGTEQTFISGTLRVASGKTVNLQDLTITGSTLYGSGTVSFDKVALNDAFIDCNANATEFTIPGGSTVTFTSGFVHGGAIELRGGASTAPTTIVCGGSSRTFEDLEVHGTTITNLGVIYGATVYSNVGDDHNIYFTEDGGATSSSVIVTGQTEYVVPGGLVQISGT